MSTGAGLCENGGIFRFLYVTKQYAALAVEEKKSSAEVLSKEMLVVKTWQSCQQEQWSY